MRPGATDVAIIGGGVIGCAVAHYLAKQGARVTIIERSVIGGGASSTNTGAIAMATKKPGPALDLAMASQLLYPGLAAELGMDVEYVVEGNLIIAESETEAAYLEDMAAAQRTAGIPSEIVSAARCRELNPLLEGRVLAGLHCSTDAQANPFKVTQGFARAAQNAGARILAHTAVESIDVAAGRVTGVRTSQGMVRADWIVNAAGAHAADIGAMVGVAHDVVPRRGQVLVLEATDGLPGMRVSGAGQLLAKHGGASGGSAASASVAPSYLSKPLSGTVLLGSTNEFVGFDTRTTPGMLAEICRRVTAVMPQLGKLNVLRSWAGLRPYSSKGALLGAAGGPAGYAVATGHGGDGVALAPITGDYLAEYIARDGKDCGLPEFLGRIKTRVARAQ